jgi:DNA-3-methyladenine glycosylase II
MSTRVVAPRGPFSLAAAMRFAEGFTPDPHAPGADPGHLHLAFVPDGGTAAAAACVRQDGPDVVVEIAGDADHASAHAQVRRILSLDVDGSGFAAVGERDAVVGKLQERFAGLRPVCFLSPFEAGVWFLLGQRIRTAQAAALKTRLRDALGQPVEICGERLVAFPGPDVVADLEPVAGIPDVKRERIRALARAATEGLLDGDRLRGMEADAAIAGLEELPGVGPFTAQGIVLRGAGAPDVLAAAEPRLGRAVALAYALQAPPAPERVAELAEPWRPYRSWVTVLLRVNLDRGAAGR